MADTSQFLQRDVELMEAQLGAVRKGVENLNKLDSKPELRAAIDHLKKAEAQLVKLKAITPVRMS